MGWPWQRTREPAPAPAADRGSRYNAAALDAFLGQARAMTAWHEARADAFERKASTLLGFAGVILVLLPTLQEPIAMVHGPRMRIFLVALAVLAAALLALAAMAATTVLMPRPDAAPSLSQLQRQWMDYVQQGEAHLPPEHLTGLFVDQLIKRANTQSSPLETLRADAAKRAKWTKRATWLVLSGVLVLAVLTSALLVEGGV